MAAFGTTIREEQFSISAKIWMDSPVWRNDDWLMGPKSIKMYHVELQALINKIANENNQQQIIV